MFETAQIEFKVARVLVAFVAMFCQRFAKNVRDFSRQSRIQGHDWRRFLINDFVERVNCRLALERTLAREHFIENHPKRKDIRAMIEYAPGSLLRRHVRYRPADYPRLGLCMSARPGKGQRC